MVVRFTVLLKMRLLEAERMGKIVEDTLDEFYDKTAKIIKDVREETKGRL